MIFFIEFKQLSELTCIFKCVIKLSTIIQLQFPMKPMYQPSQVPTNSTSYQPTFANYNFVKPYEIRPVNVPTTFPTHSVNNPILNTNGYHVNSNDDHSKKITTTIKTVQQKKDSMTPIGAKKILKYQKPAFLGAAKQSKQYHLSDTSTQIPIESIRREQSQPDLRTTCPNVFKKIEQSNRQLQNNLRYTTHNTHKYGSVITEAKKFDEEQQKNLKKNGVVNDHSSHSHKLQSPYKSMTDPKKVGSGQTNFKSLNQIYSNKQRTLQKPKRNIINGFEVYKQLGKGKFGEVYLARHIQTGFIVALKKIIKTKVTEYKMIQQFKREIKLHSALDHPNIVKFYGFFQDAENIYLILEYISGGTLFDYLAQKDMLSPKQAAQFLKDTIEALSYMHERSIAHRDIKPQNIVLTAQKVAKLCDFGWSALVESSRTTYCGTFDYAPPEILQRKNYDTAVDMWCIGVLAFELLTGRVPFQGQKRKQVMQKIISVDKTKIMYPVQIPEDAKSFIELLVQKDPNQRPKCKDLLRHPFIVNNTKKPVPTAIMKQKQKKL